MPADPAVHFTATLRPYRSLSARGFRWVIGAAIAGNLVIGLPLLVRSEEHTSELQSH